MEKLFGIPVAGFNEERAHQCPLRRDADFFCLDGADAQQRELGILSFQCEKIHHRFGTAVIRKRTLRLTFFTLQNCRHNASVVTKQFPYASITDVASSSQYADTVVITIADAAHPYYYRTTALVTLILELQRRRAVALSSMRVARHVAVAGLAAKPPVVMPSVDPALESYVLTQLVSRGTSVGDKAANFTARFPRRCTAAALSLDPRRTPVSEVLRFVRSFLDLTSSEILDHLPSGQWCVVGASVQRQPGEGLASAASVARAVRAVTLSRTSRIDLLPATSNAIASSSSSPSLASSPPPPPAAIDTEPSTTAPVDHSRCLLQHVDVIEGALHSTISVPILTQWLLPFLLADPKIVRKNKKYVANVVAVSGRDATFFGVPDWATSPALSLATDELARLSPTESPLFNMRVLFAAVKTIHLAATPEYSPHRRHFPPKNTLSTDAGGSSRPLKPKPEPDNFCDLSSVSSDAEDCPRAAVERKDGGEVPGAEVGPRAPVERKDGGEVFHFRVLGADDYLPVLIFVLAKVRPVLTVPFAVMELMWGLLGSYVLATSEQAYYLTMVSSAFEYLAAIDPTTGELPPDDLELRD